MIEEDEDKRIGRIRQDSAGLKNILILNGAGIPKSSLLFPLGHSNYRTEKILAKFYKSKTWHPYLENIENTKEVKMI